MITGYYLLKQLKIRKSQRFDVVAHAGDEIELLEEVGRKAKDGRPYCYYTIVPPTFNEAARAQATRALTSTKSITGLFTPIGGNGLTAFGDVKGTNDALFAKIAPDGMQMEIWIAKGLKAKAAQLYYNWMAGDFADECEKLRAQATQRGALPTTEPRRAEQCTTQFA